MQEEFEKFLDERGVNESLALFVPDYAEYKEQKVCLQSSGCERCCGMLTTCIV